MFYEQERSSDNYSLQSVLINIKIGSLENMHIICWLPQAIDRD